MVVDEHGVCATRGLTAGREKLVNPAEPRPAVTAAAATAAATAAAAVAGAAAPAGIRGKRKNRWLWRSSKRITSTRTGCPYSNLVHS